MMDDDDGFDATDAGLLFGFYRYGQDRQTEALVNALRSDDDGLIRETDVPATKQTAVAVNALEWVKANLPTSWDDYIGQQPLKDRLTVVVAAAKARGVRLPHILLASGYPGVGKTTVARLLKVLMGVDMIELVPPFKVRDLLAAVLRMKDGDIVFIDEIHILAANGKRGAELLLSILLDGVAFLDGKAIKLPDVTYIGATTDKDMLPEPVVDRFKIRPYFQAYDRAELARIAVVYADRVTEDPYWIPDDLLLCIADACRQTPRIVEEMVDAARDLAEAHAVMPTPAELLAFVEVEPDGLTRQHVHYLTAMRQYFARETKDGGVEYIIGAAAIQQILRETTQGVGRVERFLVERGLVDRTPRGRRLTDLGISRAEQFIAVGKGAANVA